MEEELNKKWNIHKLVQEAINTSHSEPSPETRERLATLETNHTNLMEKIEEILSRLEKFDEKLDKALEKKANKWVETAMIWGFSAAGVVLIGLLIRWVVLLDLGQ